MAEFLGISTSMLWSVVSTLIVLAVIAQNWEHFKWWWHNTWYSFPLIGKIASLARDPNRDAVDSTWFKAEKTLCRDYKKLIRIQDEHDFNQKIAYLTKAGDNGRKDSPNLIWFLTTGLVFVEAMGFAYVLAGYTLPGASENLQQIGAYGIAFLISVILVAFTHFTGQELYKSGRIKTARQEWIEGQRKGKTSTGTVPLARDQSIDDAQPGYVQLMNRVGTVPNYSVSICTLVFVTVVAIGATYVRGQVLEKQLHQQSVGQVQNAVAQAAIKSGQDGLDMSAPAASAAQAAPETDAKANQQAAHQAIQDDISIDRHGGWGTFIILAFIFVFLQILGVYFGYRWGFAGGDSKAAYQGLGSGRYATYNDMREHYKMIADTAQAKLEHLQQKIMLNNSEDGTDGLHTTKTFFNFMDAERQRETFDRMNEMQHTAKRMAAKQAYREPKANDSFAEIMQKLEVLGDDKEAKKKLIYGLSESLKAQVVEELTRLKSERARKAKQAESELDGLL